MGIEVGAGMQVDTTSGPERNAPHQRGATAVEYALLMTLIAAAIIGAVGLFGDNVAALFDVEFPP